MSHRYVMRRHTDMSTCLCVFWYHINVSSHDMHASKVSSRHINMSMCLLMTCLCVFSSHVYVSCDVYVSICVLCHDMSRRVISRVYMWCWCVYMSLVMSMCLYVSTCLPMTYVVCVIYYVSCVMTCLDVSPCDICCFATSSEGRSGRWGGRNLSPWDIYYMCLVSWHV